MKVRMAQEKDIERIHSLLAQVAMVHHKGRPDLFKPGKSKYTDEELKDLLQDSNRPILAAVDDNDCMQGYAFCIFQQYKDHNIMTDIKTCILTICAWMRPCGESISESCCITPLWIMPGSMAAII